MKLYGSRNGLLSITPIIVYVIWKSRAQWDALYAIVFTPEFQAKKQTLEHQLDSLKGLTSGLKNSVGGLRPRVEGGMNNKIEQAKNSIQMLAGQVKDSVNILARNKVAELKDSVDNKIKPVKDSATNAVNMVRDSVSSRVEIVKDSIDALTNKINGSKTKALDYSRQALKKKAA